ncbi:MAG: hypothetical protein ACE37F_01650 [Nannocystaceae bacterium]|nr:hypothetical protein [bacterium]
MIVVAGRGPMAVVQFRFDGGPPSSETIDSRLRGLLGSRLHAAVDGIDWYSAPSSDLRNVVRVSSQDYIALAYVKRVCADLGGTRIDTAGKAIDGQPEHWTCTPWRSKPALTRLKIRLGMG